MTNAPHLCAWCRSEIGEDGMPIVTTAERYLELEAPRTATHDICPVCVAKELSQLDITILDLDDLDLDNGGTND